MKIWEATPRPFDRATKALWPVIVILVMLGAGCSSSDNGVIPITTSSERAREYFRLGRDLEERLRPSEARPYYKEALGLDSNFALAYLYLAGTESTTDDRCRLLDKAAALLDGVSEGEKLMIQAGLASNTGDRFKEQQYYQQLTVLHPDIERAHNLLGDYYLNALEFEQAIAEYQKSIKINPNFPPAYNGLGYAYSHLVKYAEAEKCFLKYIELIPNDPNPYDSYAELLLRMGRFSESLDYYQQALRKNPYFFFAYVGMASVYNYLGHYDEARTQLETLNDRARTSTHQRMAQFALAVSYTDEGNLDAALDQMRKSYAIAKQAKDVLAMAEDLDHLGDILLECGKSDQALKNYTQAAKLVEQSSLAKTIKETAEQTYLYNATHVAIHHGDLATAKKRAGKYRDQAAASYDPIRSKLSHELTASIALAEKDHQTALAELQYTDLQDPYNLYRLVQVYRGLGDRQKAQEMAQEIAVFYADNNLNYAFIRSKATEILAAYGTE